MHEVSKYSANFLLQNIGLLEAGLQQGLSEEARNYLNAWLVRWVSRASSAGQIAACRRRAAGARAGLDTAPLRAGLDGVQGSEQHRSLVSKSQDKLMPLNFAMDTHTTPKIRGL